MMPCKKLFTFQKNIPDWKCPSEEMSGGDISKDGISQEWRYPRGEFERGELSGVEIVRGR